jgi:hypothetical protein
VPLLALGRFAKANFVSHVQLEHSSVVKFLEWNFLDGVTGQLGAPRRQREQHRQPPRPDADRQGRSPRTSASGCDVGCTLDGMEIPGLDDLRGATFDDLTVDWRNGIVLLGFLPSTTRTGCRALRATSVTRVALSRGSGASAIVKDVRCSDTDGSTTGASLELTMDSGEVVRVEAASFAVSVTAG